MLASPTWMGIDEAGVGEVVGSFYIGYVKTDAPGEIASLKVRDSKSLNRTALEKTFSKISRHAETGVLPISATELETMSREGITLTDLETSAIASLVNSSTPDVLQIDCYYPREEMLERRLRKLIFGQAAGVDLRISHEAERKWPLVAAAGIVAKMHQTWELDRLRHLHGDVFGSGNGSDSRTRDYVQRAKGNSYFVRSHNVPGN